MKRTAQKRREDAQAIWNSGVDAVRSDRLVRQWVRIDGDSLHIGDERIPLASMGRIVVLGAGKAGAGMAQGLEQALGPEVMRQKNLTGWINTPADCVKQLERIHLHAARPAGLNEPTAEGVQGAEKMLELVQSLDDRDLCLCLLSGGGSALTPAPIEGVSLGDKQQVTRFLSAAGANIDELNTVRKHLSRFKGGALARACRAGRLITLIISDVMGDPLDIIASGPTIQAEFRPDKALAVLSKFDPHRRETPAAVWDRLETLRKHPPLQDVGGCRVINLVIGNNAAAVDAAGMEAERRGYNFSLSTSSQLEDQAEEVGVFLAKMAMRMRSQLGPDCLISGGEPIVKLAPVELRGRGGRNQQLVLAGLIEWIKDAQDQPNGQLEGMLLLSGGTDGEDGPTDAAGAWADSEVIGKILAQGMDPQDYLDRNDAYTLFDAVGSLIKTGPTHTNVCDLRVVLVERNLYPSL